MNLDAILSQLHTEAECRKQVLDDLKTAHDALKRALQALDSSKSTNHDNRASAPTYSEGELRELVEAELSNNPALSEDELAARLLDHCRKDRKSGSGLHKRLKKLLKTTNHLGDAP